MIQRIQTVYLLLTFILLAVGCYFEPMGYGKGLMGGCSLLSLIIVFLYKNRNLQITLCGVAMASGVLYYIALAALQPVIGWHSALPMVALLLLFKARKSIVKDEKLVKSLDRIR